MRMLADNVLVRPEPWTTVKQGSILLPDNAKVKDTFARGVVKRVGPGLFHPDGSRPPIEVKADDHILFYKRNGVPIVVSQEEHLIVSERDILGILEPEDFQDEPNESIEENK